jgi:hypothetical protein
MNTFFTLPLAKTPSHNQHLLLYSIVMIDLKGFTVKWLALAAIVLHSQ